MTTTRIEPFILICDRHADGIIEVHAIGANAADVQNICTALENAVERLQSVAGGDEEDIGYDIDFIGTGDIATGCRINNYPNHETVASCIREMFSARTVLEAK